MKQRIFRLGQELPFEDLNRLQAYRDEALTTALADAVTDGRGYSGFVVTQNSATEISIAPGRFYSAGLAYVAEAATTMTLLARLPAVAKRKLAIVVWGQDVETDIEPRDFLVDVNTGATEPRSVALTALRQAQIGDIAGSEAADPPTPAVPPTALLLALVTLTPAGVSLIEQEPATRLPTVAAAAQGVDELRAWRASISPRVDTLTTQQLALADATAGKAGIELVADLSVRLADAERKLKLPAGAMSSETDDFSSNSLTDTGLTGANALVDRGLLFPPAAVGTFDLALFNPNDAAVKRSAAGLILPRYDEVLRLTSGVANSDMSASALQVATWTTRAITVVEAQTRYRPGYWYETVANADGTFGSIPHYAGMDSYIEYVPVTRYEQVATTTNFNGMLVAQTFVAPSAMWATKVNLSFTQVGTTGDVVLLLVETINGKPDLSRVLTRTTVAQAGLKRAPEKTPFPLEPVMLDAGRRYGLVVITQGDHRLGVVGGNAFTEGTLFTGSDGDYVTGDLTRDLFFDLYGAAFSAPRTEVALQPIDLAGGVVDIAATIRRLVPDGCELALEVFTAGRWYLLGSPELPDTLPAVVQVRAVFLGSRDLAPAVWEGEDVITASRPALNLTHYSTNRTLAAASTDIRVILDLARFDAARHGATITLRKADTTEVTASLVTTEVINANVTRKTFKFAPSPGLTTYRIKTALTRTGVGAPTYGLRRTDAAL